MNDKENKINKNEESSSIEDLTKYIKDSKEMNSEPKKRMSLKTKAILITILGIILIVCDIVFIHKPYEFRLDFEIKDYSIYEYTFKALNNKTVIYDSKTIEIGENIVNILPYKNYQDMESQYIVMLSEYGKIYTYNLSNNTLKSIENVNKNIKEICQNKLDIYDVIEIIFEDETRKILGNEKILDFNIEYLKIMDKVIFKYDNYVVYLLNDNMYICDYNKVRHFRMETEDYYAETMTNPKKIVDLNGNDIDVCDGKAIIYDNCMYIYGITTDKKLIVYKYTLDNYLSLPENIQVNPIEFTKDILGFDDNHISKYSVRLDIGVEEKGIDVFLDKIIFGSLSNDNFIMTYITDFSNGINYNNVEDRNGNYRYEGRYYTFENFDVITNTYKIDCVFLTSYNALAVVTFSFDQNNKFSYTCRYPKLEENQSIEYISTEEDKVYITIKEVTENEFIVFEDYTDIKYNKILLEEFINN